MDIEAYTDIFNELYPRLCRFLECLLGNSSLAQDIAQESLLRLYRLGSDKLPHKEIRYWVFRVARNLANNELKKKQTQVKLLTRLANLFRPQPANIEKELILAEQTAEVFRLLATLSLDQRSALLLREQEELSYQEIAQVLGVSESKVKVDIFRARNLLREKWKTSGATSTQLQLKNRRD